jgi:hypothetical protein
MLHSLRKIAKYIFSEHRYVIDKLILKRKALSRDVPKTSTGKRRVIVMQKKKANLKVLNGNVKKLVTIMLKM